MSDVHLVESKVKSGMRALTITTSQQVQVLPSISDTTFKTDRIEIKGMVQNLAALFLTTGQTVFFSEPRREKPKTLFRHTEPGLSYAHFHVLLRFICLKGK